MIVKMCIALSTDQKDFKLENIVGSGLSILQEVFSLVYVIIFGIHSLYFKIYRRLLWFIIFSVFIIIFYTALTITTYIYELSLVKKADDLQNVTFFKTILLYICLSKTALYFLAIFMTHKERRKILQQINESPYNIVDEEFTEQMYKNIIDHSINPKNKDVKEEFYRYTMHSIEKGKQKSMKSLPFSVNSSNSSSNIEKERDTMKST
jgi:FlaA1/EpsC-like NDP-sugar epimerase